MKYCPFVAPIFAVLLLVGCSDKLHEIKSGLSSGDKVLIETPEEIFLSLNNDSLVVCHRLNDDAIDTILNSGKYMPGSRRLGVVASPARIMMLVHAPNDSILASSYDIAKHEIINSSRSYGMGIMPYQGTDSVKIVLPITDDDAIYEASYYIRSDASGSPTIALNKTIYNKPKQRARRSSGFDDPFMEALFGSQNNGRQYWWHCSWCDKSVKSSGEPPRSGCYRNNGYHVWRRGERAN